MTPQARQEVLARLLSEWVGQATPRKYPARMAATWLVVGGRGAGKTRLGAEWVNGLVRGLPPFSRRRYGQIALVGETLADVREVMIDGPSGILTVARGTRPRFEATRRRLVWDSGAVAFAFSSEDPDSLRGPQFDAAWLDEFAKWKNIEACFDMLQFGLRLGEEPLTLAEAKAHIRVAHDADDTLIAGLIRAARQEVERAAGLALIAQSWRLALDDWPASGCAPLRIHPVTEILSVTVFDADGGASLLPAQDYEVDIHARPARLLFGARRDPLRRLNGIEIDFTAGFGATGVDVPDILKRAMLLLVAHWYELRGAYAADDQPASYPPGYDRLVAHYRSPRL